MADPLVLPCEPEQLARDVARLWPGAAAVAGVDPRLAAVGTHADGSLFAIVRVHVPPAGSVSLALEHLARSLEDAGYEVQRDGSARVVLGWAAARVSAPRIRGGHMLTVIRIADLTPWHPARADRGERLLRERQERDRETAPHEDAKRRWA